jgi:hypothetical protein
VDNVVVLDKSDLGFLTDGGWDCRLNLEGVVEVLGIRISTGVETEVMMMVMMTTTLERMMAITTVTTRDCSEGVWWFLRCVFVAVEMGFVKDFCPRG